MSGKRRDQAAGGAGQKSGRSAALLPPSVPRAEFFPDRLNFDLFGNPVVAFEAPPAAVGRRVTRKSADIAEAARRLSEAGLTRRKIAHDLGIGVSTLYKNYFPEIGGRAGRPGRRQHAPSAEQRRLVAMRAAQGAALPTIAAELGLSVPTLRKHYRAELS